MWLIKISLILTISYFNKIISTRNYKSRKANK
ncbi:hypothetical protein CKO_03761 [Citrobacter koseri ATCC BAA-895]|uniref:Uncharacterized protein n=1 Tax=Citrobacter koseri (strain ATCC BAA-895 / CDC 4225-83 / SGSC4696) TaxID=290338 RepID=A8AMX4_CITK8|nr:hypothetical protein CKO_03761 [Citrobacter koseri ATCC BAA-895]